MKDREVERPHRRCDDSSGAILLLGQPKARGALCPEVARCAEQWQPGPLRPSRPDESRCTRPRRERFATRGHRPCGGQREREQPRRATAAASGECPTSFVDEPSPWPRGPIPTDQLSGRRVSSALHGVVAGRNARPNRRGSVLPTSLKCGPLHRVPEVLEW